jgi:hypothetical protein
MFFKLQNKNKNVFIFIFKLKNKPKGHSLSSLASKHGFIGPNGLLS